MTTKKNFTSRHLSPAKKAWITRKIKSGKSKYQTAKELGISYKAVYRNAKDLPSKPCGWPGIRGKTLELLQELLMKGYKICSHEDPKSNFFTLKKYFPILHRTKMNNKTIFYLEGHENNAAKAFLENTSKKIISYQQIIRITDVFNTNLTKKEKESFLFRKQGSKEVKNPGVQKDVSLREKDDSFSFFYIRGY
jgi:hypothetical protein